MGLNCSVILDDLYKIAGIGSFIFVAYQAAMFKKDYNVKNDKAEREKAIELSKFYNENILVNRISYIDEVFKESGVQELLNLKYTQLKEFDKQELDDLIGDDNLEKINKKIKDIDINILIKASTLLKPHSYNEHIDNLIIIDIDKKINSINSITEAAATLTGDHKKYEEKDIKKIEEGIESIDDIDDIDKIKGEIENNREKYLYYKIKYVNQFNYTLCETLNLLEYFCMNFNSGIADEETVYQSLHQTFLGTVKLLYFKIAQINITGKDKYYTNIIKLFNKWSDRHDKQHQKEIRLHRCTTFEKDSIKK